MVGAISLFLCVIKSDKISFEFLAGTHGPQKMEVPDRPFCGLILENCGNLSDDGEPYRIM